jgi:hypothetical protein
MDMQFLYSYNVDHEVDEPTKEGSVIVTQFSNGE